MLGYFSIGLPCWLCGKEDMGLILGQEDALEKEIATHPVLLWGKCHGQRSLAGYSSWGCKRVRHDLATKQQQ